jgi:hypothetical protein
MTHHAALGIVKVEESESESGITYDTESARQASITQLAEQDRIKFQNYVNSCVEDYIKRNKPVPPPSPVILRIIERRGYDLKKFGIVPIGWEEPERDKALADLKAENIALKSHMADMSSKMDLLTQMMAKKAEPEPEPVEAPEPDPEVGTPIPASRPRRSTRIEE